MKYRIGFGYDIHRLEQRRSLWLGGVLVSEELGAVGHSDADVLIHAICDGILGAIGERDIGVHFPDTSEEYKGISSMILLERVVALANRKGYGIEQVDSTICLQSPKISGFIPEMRHKIAGVAGAAMEDISIKATTKEGLGAVGRGEGIEAYAVVLLSGN